ncbi:hypothetical protein JTE90_022770 [Oedothorax gibbosus]|uniref:SEC14-like protein 2 n=1 Tax=Oedothorax gibbosus TaxID=931172 RepID=A0AAV6UB07_9ARAC|nr:hypothetical protein JTE90_022770 [Oedothorax gibbosus]
MTQDSVNEIEKSNVDELRRRMKDLMNREMYDDDNLFQRFLRARNQNLDLAEQMLKNHLRWRKMHRVDTIKQDFKPLEVMLEYDGMSHIGFDKEGAPVIYCAFGKMDFRGAYRCVNMSDLYKFILYKLEHFVDLLKEQSKKLGKPVTQWVMIFDYESFTFANATFKPVIHYLVGLMSMYEGNYPERLKSAHLINGSMIFSICFAMFKPFFTGNTLSKVNYYGSDFQDDLLKTIDADQLPAFLGGIRKDPDGNPRCLKTIKHGGVIPEKYYVTGRNRKMSVIPGAKMLIIARRAKASVEVEVKRPGANLEWRYTIRNRTIDFSVFYKECKWNEDELEEVIPKQRVETVVSSEFGMCLCEKAGTYILEFDNSFSWLYGKSLSYSVTVTNPLN